MNNMNLKKPYNNDEFIARYVEGTLTREEEEALNRISEEERSEFSDYRHLWAHSSTIKLTPGKSADERWNLIFRRLFKNNHQTRPVKRGFPFSVFLAAASILLIIISAFWWNNYNRPLMEFAGNGETKTVVLPCGSEVILNAGSEMTYHRNRWEKERLVELKGEAFFRVEKGTRFRVNTGFLVTQVLGTSFNIKARDNKVEVACVEGRVKVFSSQAEKVEVVLSPGLLTIAQNGANPDTPEEFDVEGKTGWINGRLYFHNTPLCEVFSELERQFNIVFKNKDKVANLTFSGHLSTDNKKDAIDIVCIASGISYQFLDESTILIN